ncbi:hypothetical protein B0I12_001915 [Microbacterium hydrothermale]|uniref:Rv0361 family membrane protein n=1 Tax=Microbacterium hydrothermale TaxID=857427 RepID=UPI002226DE4D|nr:hypothetical protein [Microbacterium hydrothermale]MCW2164780.1 hypothetical protein [Microbacterium hydrothermale]
MSSAGRRIAPLLLIGVAVLGGCAAPAAESGGDGEARTTVDTFLRAVADGRYSEALPLTTLGADGLICSALADDSSTSKAIAAPEVTGLRVNGDSATAEVSYRAPAATTVTLALTRESDTWRITFPDEWRLAVGFDGPTVARVSIDDACDIPSTDGGVDGPAWPGRYQVTVSDPTGVLERSESFLYEVPDGSTTGLDVDPLSLPAVPEDELALVQSEATPLLRAAFEKCADAAFSGSSCPRSLEGVTAAGTSAPSDGYLAIDRLYTDDGDSWRFDSGTGSLAVTKDGTPTTIEFHYSGTVSRGADGTLSLAFD